jgi:hypothetical protein
MSLFSDIRDYINSKPNGEIIYRMDLNSYFSSTSVDQYRRRLTLLGYLTWVGNGQYEKIKDIPENFTSADSLYAYKNKRTKLNKNGKSKKNS